MAPRRLELATQQRADLALPGVDQLGEVGNVIAVPAQPRLEFVELWREQGLDELCGDRLLTDPPAFLECAGEILLDLQRGPKTLRQKLDAFLGDDVAGADAFGEALHQ